jgi:protein-S-isoprenylcysteine O-methyltransferase Ste14
MSGFFAENIKSLLFIIALILELFYIWMFIWTIRRPGFRFWPPPCARSWQFFVAWIVASLAAVFFLFLGLLDFDSFVFHQWIRFPIAIGVVLCTSIIGTWTDLTFGLRGIIGLGGKLVTTGPYRYTRNPQYVCDGITIFAYMLFTNSVMVWIIGGLAIVLNILAPFTEEPWLEERFGDAYLEYKRIVPRFIGLRTKSARVRSQDTP